MQQLFGQIHEKIFEEIDKFYFYLIRVLKQFIHYIIRLIFLKNHVFFI